MNIFDIVQSARTPVDPMALAERRKIREELFGAGPQDSTRTITARSDSGAVVSTAPHGFRIPVQQRRRRRGLSTVKTAAGLVLVAIVGAAAWSSFSGDSATDETIDSTTAPTTTVAPTVAPTSVEAPAERTGVSRSEPLILPATLLTASELTIAPATAGIGTAVLTAPDGSNVWIGEFDGVADPLAELELRQVGSVLVAALEQPVAVSYRISVPCGVVVMNDAPGEPAFRPAIETLINAMSVDANATIDVSLPNGWSVLDVGSSEPTYTAEFQVPFFADTVPVRLSQVPDGSLSQLAFGGRQLGPITFLGGAAFIDTAPNTPTLLSIYWRDDNTVFNVSSTRLALTDLESFVRDLEPATIDTWSTRFDLAVPDPAPLNAECSPQPSFGSTLDP